MMNVFNESKAMLPPFWDYLKYKYKEKQYRYVRNWDSTPSIYLYNHIINDIINLENQTNIDIHMYIAAIAKHVVKAFLKELRDPKKTTYIYLSIRNRDLLHEDITNKDIINSMNTAIVNNSCKSIFGVATE